MIKKRSVAIAGLLLVLQFLCYYSLRSFPDFIERWYSTGIYVYISKAMRYGLGWIPFSFGDVMYAVGIIMIIRWLWISKRDLITLSRKRYLQLLTALNIIIALFHVLWGFNYYRLPLHAKLNQSQTYTLGQLKTVATAYVNESNKLHEQLQSNDSLPVIFNRSQQELFEIAAPAFAAVPQKELQIAMGPVSIKKSLLTVPLSYMGYSGYLNPITGEAQTNGYINFYKTPVLILHEMSHQLGYAKENEANFMAINAGLNHKDLYFKYSASIFAMQYLLEDLALKDRAAFDALKEKIRPGILVNYREQRKFWEYYQGNLVEKVSHATYNQYLKANNQPAGMQTYSYVVALVVNGYVKQ